MPSNRQRKLEQRKVNRAIHRLNRNLLNDELWRGRFECHQKDADWQPFTDGSGGVLECLIEYRDKKTGRCWLSWSQDLIIYMFNEHYLKMNDFIVRKSGVYDDIESVKNDKTDWSRVKFEVKEIVE